MQLSAITPPVPLAAPRLTPSPRPSADHANFDVLAFRDAAAMDQRVGLVARSRFYSMRGGSSALQDAATAAREIVVKTGQAHAILATHPGMLFVAPLFVRTADGSKVPLAGSLAAFDGAELVGRHGKVLGIVGADRFVDLQALEPTLGSGRG